MSKASPGSFACSYRKDPALQPWAQAAVSSAAGWLCGTPDPPQEPLAVQRAGDPGGSPRSPALAPCACPRRWPSTKPPFPKQRNFGQTFPSGPAEVLPSREETQPSLTESFTGRACKPGAQRQEAQAGPGTTYRPPRSGRQPRRSVPRPLRCCTRPL